MIAKRLAALEARQPEPEDDGAVTARLMARMNQIRERLQAQPGWKPPTEAEIEETKRMIDAKFGRPMFGAA